MSKRKKIVQYLKLGTLLFGLSILLWNCEKEQIIPFQKKTNYKTVNHSEALAFLETKSNKLLKSSNAINLTFDTSLITHESLIHSNEQLTIIPAKTKRKDIYSRILILKVNGILKSVLFNMIPEKLEKTKKFTGIVSITALNGKFLNGFKVKEGVFVSRFVKKKKLQQASVLLFMFFQEDEDECDENLDPSSEFCDNTLEEVRITGRSNQGTINLPSLFLKTIESDEREESGGGFSDEDEREGAWDYWKPSCPGIKIKDANGKCVCPDGFIEDFNGNCVIDPCSKIKSEIQNPVFYNKINALKRETGKKKETGYMQNKDGSYTQLTDTNNGHSLNIPINASNSVGFMHTHLDDYLTGKIDEKTGRPEITKPIKMFSPKDILNFLRIVKNTKYNGVPLSSVYGTMVSSTGTYTLRFTGNPNDVSNSLSLNKKEYKKYFVEYYKDNKEKAFLNYLKDKVHINGLHLFKVKNNNTIKEKTLSNNGGSVNSNNCN